MKYYTYVDKVLDEQDIPTLIIVPDNLTDFGDWDGGPFDTEQQARTDMEEFLLGMVEAYTNCLKLFREHGPYIERVTPDINNPWAGCKVELDPHPLLLTPDKS